MKRQIWKRSLSVLVAASILLTSSGCADNKTDSVQLSWESDEKDWVSIDASAAKDGGRYIVTLSAGTERFAEEVAKGSVMIKALSYGPESEGAVLVSEDITVFDVEKVSESELKLSFDSSANYEAIHVGVHKNVMESGKYAEAYWSDSSYDVAPVYSANIGGAISEYEKDPVITVKLNGAAPSAGLTKDMLTLTDRFSGLEITDVKGEDGTIVISTSGTVEDGDSCYGGVTLSAGATTAGEELSAEIVIAVRSGYLVHDSFAFASGELSFDVAFDNDTFTAAAGEEIVCDDITYTVKAVSADKLTVTLAVAAGAEDIDTAIDMIDNKALVIPAAMTGSQSEHIVMLHAVEASIGGYLDYVDEAEAEDTFTATAVLYVKNGEWGELTADDLSFGGDFADATNIELEKDGDSYTVTFDFVYIGADLEETTFDGDITVAHDNMKNEWGSSGDSEYIQLCYLPVSDRDPEDLPGTSSDFQTLELPYPSYRDALLNLNGTNYQSLKDAWSFAQGVGAVGSVISGVQTILGICGVIENTDAKIERVSREILTSLGNLDKKMDSLGAAISANGADVITAVHGTAFNTTSLGWNNFLNDYAAPLTKIMNSYNSKYNEYIHDYVNRSGVSHCVTVYIDENGKVTLPGSMTGYSVDGVKIVKEVECLLSAELSDVKSKILKNKDKLYEGYWEDITASDISLIDIDGEPVEDISDDDYFAAVQMDAAMYALNEVGKDNIINDFVNFCNALAGYNAGSSVPKSAVKPLDYYYQMMYYFYNFYSEAKEDISIIRTWLKDTLFKGSAIATLAYTFYPAAQKDIVANAVALAINELSVNDGEHNDNYCYIAGKDLSCTEVFPYNTINDGKVISSCVSANRTWANPIVFPSTGKFMTETEVALMIRRYEMLKSKSILGTQGTETFGDYLVTRAIMPEAFKNGIVLTSAPSKQPIPLNEKIQLKIQWKHEDSSWFNVGEEVEVGDYEKLSKKYFTTKYTYYWISDTIDLNGTITHNNMLAALGRYAESFFIVGSEIYHLEYKHPNSLLIFNLS